MLFNCTHCEFHSFWINFFLCGQLFRKTIEEWNKKRDFCEEHQYELLSTKHVDSGIIPAGWCDMNIVTNCTFLCHASNTFLWNLIVSDHCSFTPEYNSRLKPRWKIQIVSKWNKLSLKLWYLLMAHVCSTLKVRRLKYCGIKKGPAFLLDKPGNDCNLLKCNYSSEEE